MDQIVQITSELSRQSLGKDTLGLHEDFFDLGASSLTVVDLQVQLEARLGLRAATSALMRAPSIQGWSEVYQALARDAVPG